MSNAVAELTEATFDEVIVSSPEPVVVEFWAEWCPPCRTMAPVLDSIAADFEDHLWVVKVNSDDHPELARRHEVMSVPPILAFSEGQLRQRMVGARSRARLLEDLSDLIR